MHTEWVHGWTEFVDGGKTQNHINSITFIYFTIKRKRRGCRGGDREGVLNRESLLLSRVIAFLEFPIPRTKFHNGQSQVLLGVTLSAMMRKESFCSSGERPGKVASQSGDNADLPKSPFFSAVHARDKAHLPHLFMATLILFFHLQACSKKTMSSFHIASGKQEATHTHTHTHTHKHTHTVSVPYKSLVLMLLFYPPTPFPAGNYRSPLEPPPSHRLLIS